ncbi:hypothetical protein EJB05_12532, partial [Eragrostis curvula]
MNGIITIGQSISDDLSSQLEFRAPKLQRIAAKEQDSKKDQVSELLLEGSRRCTGSLLCGGGHGEAGGRWGGLEGRQEGGRSPVKLGIAASHRVGGVS